MPARHRQPGGPSAECSLAAALALASPGDTIDLATPGTADYVGNWAVTTPATTATAPVTIQAAPGLASQPVLDGNNGASTGCSTASCAGPVLTVSAGEYVALTGITIAGGNTALGGGLQNAGTVTITRSTFTGNDAFVGGAIDTGDGSGLGGTGSVTVTDSTFTGNTAAEGGAISAGESASTAAATGRSLPGGLRAPQSVRLHPHGRCDFRSPDYGTGPAGYVTCEC